MPVNAAPPREAPPGRLAGRWVPVERHYNTLAKRYPPKTAVAGEDDEVPPTRLSTDGSHPDVHHAATLPRSRAAGVGPRRYPAPYRGMTSNNSGADARRTASHR